MRVSLKKWHIWGTIGFWEQFSFYHTGALQVPGIFELFFPTIFSSWFSKNVGQLRWTSFPKGVGKKKVGTVCSSGCRTADSSLPSTPLTEAPCCSPGLVLSCRLTLTCFFHQCENSSSIVNFMNILHGFWESFAPVTSKMTSHQQVLQVNVSSGPRNERCSDIICLLIDRTNGKKHRQQYQVFLVRFSAHSFPLLHILKDLWRFQWVHMFRDFLPVRALLELSKNWQLTRPFLSIFHQSKEKNLPKKPSKNPEPTYDSWTKPKQPNDNSPLSRHQAGPRRQKSRPARQLQ